jgi:transcriptional regulator with XRE-family HTH domain
MARSAEDERAGRLLREIRHRAGITQRELAARAGVPRRDVILVEGGNGGSISLDRARATFEAAGARFRIAIWWGGAAADRLLDERHAALVERAVAVLRRRGWNTVVEASFSEYGERGSIDLLGARPGGPSDRLLRDQIRIRFARGNQQGARHQGTPAPEDRRGPLRLATHRRRSDPHCSEH